MKVVSLEKIIDFINNCTIIGQRGITVEEQQDAITEWVEGNSFKIKNTCVWEYNEATGYYETSCEAIYKDKDEETCPFCGRKIKGGVK